MYNVCVHVSGYYRHHMHLLVITYLTIRPYICASDQCTYLGIIIHKLLPWSLTFQIILIMLATKSSRTLNFLKHNLNSYLSYVGNWLTSQLFPALIALSSTHTSLQKAEVNTKINVRVQFIQTYRKDNYGIKIYRYC